MSTRHIAAALTGTFVALVALQASEARVVKFDVEEQSPFVGGADWGDVGPYEMLRGTAYLEVDPSNPRDAVIVDLANAPRNAQGLV